MLPVYPGRCTLSMNFALLLMCCRIQRLLSGKDIKSCPFNVVIEVISRSSLTIIARVILNYQKEPLKLCEQVICNEESCINN